MKTMIIITVAVVVAVVAIIIIMRTTKIAVEKEIVIAIRLSFSPLSRYGQIPILFPASMKIYSTLMSLVSWWMYILLFILYCSCFFLLFSYFLHVSSSQFIFAILIFSSFSQFFPFILPLFIPCFSLFFSPISLLFLSLISPHTFLCFSSLFISPLCRHHPLPLGH